MTDYLLRVFRISIPHMPKTAVKFGQELQLVLQPMIVKPSNVGGVVVGRAHKSKWTSLTSLLKCLQESVACMCGAVQHLTHDFHRLVALLKSCNGWVLCVETFTSISYALQPVFSRLSPAVVMQ